MFESFSRCENSLVRNIPWEGHQSSSDTDGQKTTVCGRRFLSQLEVHSRETRIYLIYTASEVSEYPCRRNAGRYLISGDLGSRFHSYGKPYGTLPTKMSFYYKLCTLVGVSNFRRCCLYLVGRRCLHLVGRRCLHLVGRRCSIVSADDVCILSADDVSSCRPTMFHLVGRRCSILSADDVCNLSTDDVSSCRPTMFASLT